MEDKNLKQKMGIASSADPTKISLMIRAGIVMITLLGGFFGFDLDDVLMEANITEENLNSVIMAVILALGGMASMATAIYGAVRKVMLHKWQA